MILNVCAGGGSCANCCARDARPDPPACRHTRRQRAASALGRVCPVGIVRRAAHGANTAFGANRVPGTINLDLNAPHSRIEKRPILVRFRRFGYG
jgi:hypothetical protein